MKISSVRSFLLSFPFPEPIKLPFYGGERTILKRDALFIRIQTENGLVGYAPGPASEGVHHAITKVIAPWLEGRTIADPDALRVLFLDGPGANPDLAKIYCAVEVALYDLAGKAMGMPVSELIGGRVRDRIRLYGSAGM
jgi:D-galactarolactone cycloisomerase